MDGGNKSNSTFYGGLLDRFHDLEASHEKLKEQFDLLLQETKSNNVDVGDVTGSHDDAKNDSLEVPGEMRADPNWAYNVPGTFFSGSPYKNLLECMGHAVHICRASSGEFIFWNRSAEQLFGYKDYEVLGCRDEALLVDERNRGLSERIMDRLSNGLSWSGQFPFKKKSGQMFLALVTKSQLYEDGELVGTITVSSDAAVFNNLWPETLRVGQDDAKHKARGINLKKIQWRAQPPIASAFSNLAPKILLRKDGDNGQDGFSNNIGEKEQNDQLDDTKSERPPRAPAARLRFNCKFPIGKNIFNAGEGSENEVSTTESSPPLKFAEKILAKLHIGDIGIASKDKEQNGFHNASFGKEPLVESSSPVEKQASTSYNWTDAKNRAVPFPSNNKCSQAVRDSEQLRSDSPNSGENTCCSPSSSSSKGDHNESNMIVQCEIYWEDLELHEEIGQGSFAVVYRGIWNGSDVAVKVYLGNEYNDDTLLGYTKELDIMRRLRHPNVLLFMGAVSSKEKLGLVTELLPRGSLFKVLHRNNQKLDIKRRLRMALDVARGMNYLHHRNPPIVHRDLKSSNLLVDKSWTVKVGDFGLSKLKDATFLTAKSGRGTPQWMAPEVLRNEPSTEKSDVFSFGVILWELMTESIPWHSLNFLQVVGVVGFMDRRLDIPENLDPKVSSLIQDCWQSKQENRPSFEDIIQTMADLIQTVSGGNAKKNPWF